VCGELGVLGVYMCLRVYSFNFVMLLSPWTFVSCVVSVEKKKRDAVLNCGRLTNFQLWYVAAVVVCGCPPESRPRF